jgi:hypothetical protein
LITSIARATNKNLCMTSHTIVDTWNIFHCKSLLTNNFSYSNPRQVTLIGFALRVQIMVRSFPLSRILIYLDLSPLRNILEFVHSGQNLDLRHLSALLEWH